MLPFFAILKPYKYLIIGAIFLGFLYYVYNEGYSRADQKWQVKYQKETHRQIEANRKAAEQQSLLVMELVKTQTQLAELEKEVIDEARNDADSDRIALPSRSVSRINKVGSNPKSD